MSKRRYKGVHFRAERNHWVARIVFKGQRIYIGSYQTEQEALEAYEQKSLELYKGYDRVNEPELAAAGPQQDITKIGGSK